MCSIRGVVSWSAVLRRSFVTIAVFRLMTSLSCCVLACFVVVLGWPIAAGQEKEPSGKVPYDRVCRVCHGPEGKGNQAPALVPFSMELEDLTVRVREGGGEMPPISENRVSDDEVKQIAAYLTLLSATSDPANANGPRDPSGR